MSESNYNDFIKGRFEMEGSEQDTKTKLHEQFEAQTLLWEKQGFNEIEIGCLWEGNLNVDFKLFLMPLYGLWLAEYFDKNEEEIIDE